MALGSAKRGRMARGALAGGLAAAVWALQQPLDKRVFRGGYDDVELLGRALLPRAPRSRWYPLGLALHVQNGAVLGAVHAAVLAPALARAGVPAAARAPLVAQVENFAVWPLGRLSDRLRGQFGVDPGISRRNRLNCPRAWPVTAKSGPARPVETVFRPRRAGASGGHDPHRRPDSPRRRRYIA